MYDEHLLRLDIHLFNEKTQKTDTLEQVSVSFSLDLVTVARHLFP